MSGKRIEFGVYGVIVIALILLFIMLGTAAMATFGIMTLPDFYWPLSLFFLTLAIGILAPMAGVGGGVIFVPLVSALYPFHVDFVRGTGLIMAFTSALAAAPKFLRTGLASLRIALPVVAIAAATSIAGASFGLYITAAFPKGKYYVLIALGIILFFIFAVMSMAKRVEFPEVNYVDGMSRMLGMKGAYFEPSLNKVVEYQATRTPLALAAFAGVGILAGMFGLGAGWANVPVLNLVMSLPIKVSTSTSILIITMTDATAAWVYLARGAILPLLVVPAVVGMYIGSRIGAIAAVKARPRVIRYIFLAIMFFAAVMDIYKGVAGLFELVPVKACPI